MSLDFELIMVLATLATGGLWGYHHWRRLRRRRAGEAVGESTGLIELGRSLFPVLLVVLIIRSFIVEPFRIPSESMVPTLLRGDFILVNKFAYGIRLPVTHNEVIETGQPERGDIVVFRYPVAPEQDYIKRVVGLPGDRVRYADKRLYINGEPVAQMPAEPYAPAPDATQRTEILGDRRHDILVYGARPARDRVYTVPEGEYFVMGDNRDRSADSRYWGTVPEGNLVGEAFFIWFNLDFQDWDLQLSRIGGIGD